MGWGGGPWPAGPGGCLAPSPRVRHGAPHCGACVAPVAGLARQCPLPSPASYPPQKPPRGLARTPDLWLSLVFEGFCGLSEFPLGAVSDPLVPKAARLHFDLHPVRACCLPGLAGVPPGKWGRLSEPQSSPLRNWAPSLPGGALPRAGTRRGLPGHPWKEWRFPAGRGCVGSPGSVTVTGRAARPRGWCLP